MEGKLWSLIRNVLSQGGAIQLDHASMSGYEEYSARLDAAAAERVTDFAKLADAKIAELQQSVAERDTKIADLETAIKRQAAAVKMLDMSHVARAETMMQHAQVLHDQSNTAALKSERQANALLTERIAELEQSVTVRDTEIARLETDLELARRDAERLDWFRTLTPHKLARIRAAFMPDSASDVRATIDAARAGNGGAG